MNRTTLGKKVFLFAALFLITSLQGTISAVVHEEIIKDEESVQPPQTVQQMEIGTDGPAFTISTADKNPGYARGRFIVKYKNEGPYALKQSAQKLLSDDISFQSATADGSDSLDKLNKTCRVKAAKSLFFNRGGMDSARARAVYKKTIDGIRKKSGKRSNAAAGDGEENLPDLSNVYVLEVPEDSDIEKISRLYAQDPHVEYAQPDYIMEAQFVPNDPYYPTGGSWGQAYDDLWGLKKIQAETAWDISQGEGITVAVVDTGLDYNHPDIAANVWTNPNDPVGDIADSCDRTANPGLALADDDCNGKTDDFRGWDFSNNDNDPMDGFGHGTHVSGTIAAVGNNGIGIIGVAPQAKIMPLKGLDDAGSGTSQNLADAIKYAAFNGADVINNSWGCSSACPSNPVVEDAVRTAYGLGVVVVFSAGNANRDVKDYSPQNMMETITVASSDQLDQKSSFSNFGMSLDVAAPGGGTNTAPPSYDPFRNVLSLKSTVINSGMSGSGQLVVGTNYLRQAGTSMAAPHVAGLAALILKANPSFSVEEVRQVIRHGSDDVGAAGFDPQSGFGRINARKALLETVPLTIVIAFPDAKSLTGGLQQVQVKGTVTGDNLTQWTLDFASEATPTIWNSIASGTTPVMNEVLGVWNIQNVLDGSYVLRLRGENSSGKIYEDRQSVTIDQIVITEPASTPLLFFRSGDQIIIKGTVAPANLSYYEIRIWNAYGIRLSNPNITLTNGGLSPVVDGVLGTWNTTGIVGNHYDIELRVWLNVNPVYYLFKSTHVVVDPLLHANWPKKLDSVSTNITDHLTAADINQDGKAEMVVGYGNSVGIYDHNGDMLPGWPQAINTTSPTAFLARGGPAVGNLTGDDHPEIVAANNQWYVFVWSHTGTLLPGWPKWIGGGFNTSVAIADMDGNGINEIVIGTDVFDINGNVIQNFAFVNFGTGRLTPPAIGDMDGNGIKEIVIMQTSAPGNLYVLTLDGNVAPGWPKAINPTLPLFHDSYPILGDLDQDGDLEVLVGSYDGKVHAFQYDGTYLPGWPQATGHSRMNSLAFGDIDGDSQPEVIGGTYDNYLYAWRANGTLLDGWPVVLGSPQYTLFGFGSPVLADVSGDGRADVVVSANPNTDYPMHLHAYRSNGTEVAGFPRPTKNLVVYSTNTVAVADMDGDNLLEMAWIDDADNFYLWDLVSSATTVNPWPMFHHDPAHTGNVATIGDSINRAPILSSIGNKVIDEGITLSFVVSATDPDQGDTLTYAVDVLPFGATLNPNTGAFVWTPDFFQSASYPVTFEVSDNNGLTDFEQITITVNNINRAPALNPVGNKVVDENQTLSFTVSASDLDNDALNFSTGNLPPGASFNPLTKTFSWTPSFSQAGSYPDVSFQVSDGLLSDSEVIAITVNNVNRAPVLNVVGNQTINEGQPLTFSVSANDPDGDDLIYNVSPLPAGAGFAGQTFSWTPGFDQSGVYNVTVTVSDGNLADDEFVVITVVIAPSITTQPANVTVTAGQTATFSVTATGTAPLSYQWSKYGATISGATSASYTTPATTTADNGALFSVVVTNSAGIVTSNNATLTVNDTIPPSIPAGLSATAISSSQINLSWWTASDNVGVTGYLVERCQGSSCTNFSQIAATTQTSFSNTGLSRLTYYRYRVRAVDAAGNVSSPSAIQTARTRSR